jgi:molybdate transport system ATP-binding protein
MSSTTLPSPLSVELRLRQPGLDIQAQFRVPPGHVCALVGRPGSGTTAVLQCAAGLIPAQSGRITIGSQVLYDEPTGVKLPPEARRFAWVDGRGQLFPHMTVRGNLDYGHRHARARQASGPAMSEVLDWLHLGPVLSHWPNQLDVVTRQKVALARALLSCPNALFLNDPLAEVPAHEQGSLLEILAEQHQRFKIPTVLSSPRMDEVIRLADDVVILHEGRVASAGPINRILSDVSLSTFLEGVHAGSVLEGVVRRHDIQWLLTEVDVAGQRITVPAVLQSEGKRVRLKVRARDISIHREPQLDSGMSNQLRGRITQVMLAGDHGSYGAVTVDLLRAIDTAAADHLSGEQLWALMTRRSIQQMALAPGQDCVVSFKSMAVSVSPR